MSQAISALKAQIRYTIFPV